MEELPDELLAEEGIAAAFAAMKQALATPWVRELMEARARSQQEDDDLLAEAHRAGQLTVLSWRRTICLHRTGAVAARPDKAPGAQISIPVLLQE